MFFEIQTLRSTATKPWPAVAGISVLARVKPASEYVTSTLTHCTGGHPHGGQDGRSQGTHSQRILFPGLSVGNPHRVAGSRVLLAELEIPTTKLCVSYCDRGHVANRDEIQRIGPMVMDARTLADSPGLIPGILSMAIPTQRS